MDIELKAKLIDIFDEEDLSDSQAFRELEGWDSLAQLSIVAMCDSAYGFTLKAADLKGLVTLGDLARYIEGHRSK